MAKKSEEKNRKPWGENIIFENLSLRKICLFLGFGRGGMREFFFFNITNQMTNLPLEQRILLNLIVHR